MSARAFGKKLSRLTQEFKGKHPELGAVSAILLSSIGENVISDMVTGNALNFSDFEYDITVVDGQVSFTGTDIVTGTEAFSMTHADAGIVLSDITQISFRAHNTTGTEAVWLDDIKMQLHTVEVPEPGTPVLFALGLFAFSVAKRRRAV